MRVAERGERVFGVSERRESFWGVREAKFCGGFEWFNDGSMGSEGLKLKKLKNLEGW